MIKHAMDCCREPINKQILGVYISRHRNIIIAESFLRSLIKLCGKYIVIVIREEYDMVSWGMYLTRAKTYTTFLI